MAQTRRKGKSTRQGAAIQSAEVFALPQDRPYRPFAVSPPRRVGFPVLHLSSELLLQFVIADLDHGRAPMGATVRKIAGQEIVNELINLGRAKLVVGLNCMATNRFCYDVLTQS